MMEEHDVKSKKNGRELSREGGCPEGKEDRIRNPRKNDRGRDGIGRFGAVSVDMDGGMIGMCMMEEGGTEGQRMGTILRAGNGRVTERGRGKEPRRRGRRRYRENTYEREASIGQGVVDDTGKRPIPRVGGNRV